MATVAASPHISVTDYTMPRLTARRQGRAGQPHSERGWEARGRTHKWSLVGKVAEDKMFGTSAGLFNAMGAISGQMKSRRDDARASKSLIFGILPCCAPPPGTLLSLLVHCAHTLLSGETKDALARARKDP